MKSAIGHIIMLKAKAKAKATFPPDPINTDFIGKWLRVKESHGITNSIASGNIYFVQGANPNNNIDVQVIDDNGSMRNLHLGRFEGVNFKELTPAEELEMILWQIKTEINES